MAQYKAFDAGVEVNGRTILAFTNALKAYEKLLTAILKKNGIEDVDPDAWYAQEKWLDSFREVGEKYGANTLFAIGKAIPENAKFPDSISSLKEALASIDLAYKMNHRGGEIGYYKLVDFKAELKLATMECKNPYPSDFDRGIITSMVRKFRPAMSIISKVDLEKAKPSRLTGSESCYYRISW